MLGDCQDGSDEPGTNACMNGLFSCDNAGYVPNTIPSSRVNDGICDCCDGSDEYNGKRQCGNTCNVLAEKMREEQEKAKQLFEVGIVKRRELVQKGAELRNLMRARSEELESKRINLESEKVKFEDIKKLAEAVAKEATDAEDKLIEEENKRQSEIQKRVNSDKLFDRLDNNHDGR